MNKVTFAAAGALLAATAFGWSGASAAPSGLAAAAPVVSKMAPSAQIEQVQYRRRYYGHRRGVGPGVALGLGVLGAAAIAGAAAGAPYYGGPAYGAYGNCWLEQRPVQDAWGNFLGYRNIRVCN